MTETDSGQVSSAGQEHRRIVRDTTRHVHDDRRYPVRGLPKKQEDDLC